MMKRNLLFGALLALPLSATADHWKGHEAWERKLWGTYTPGPTPSILSPNAGGRRHRYGTTTIVNPRTGEVSVGTTDLGPEPYCGEDDPCARWGKE